MNLSSWMYDSDELRLNPMAYAFFWARSKYYSFRSHINLYRYTLLCKMGYHITYDQVTVSQIAANGKRWYRVYRRPISHCHRCKQVVNKGIKTFFNDQKKLTSSSEEAQIDL